MTTTNKKLMAEARTALAGKWGTAMLACVIVWLVTIAAQIVPMINLVAPLLVAGPLTVGLSAFFLKLVRGEKLDLEIVFSGFDRFGTALATYLLAMLFIVLWALLLIVPGIIAAFAYSQVYFILADDKSVGPMQAIDRSKAMMKGHKWKFFCLGLRFLGWILLSILTLGIGFLWTMPYMSAAAAKFYEDVKRKAHSAHHAAAHSATA